MKHSNLTIFEKIYRKLNRHATSDDIQHHINLLFLLPEDKWFKPTDKPLCDICVILKDLHLIAKKIIPRYETNGEWFTGNDVYYLYNKNLDYTKE